MTEPATPVLDAAPDLLAEPTFEECQIEFINYFEDLKAGRLNDAMAAVPEGHYVAYYRGRIVDHDADMLVLESRAGTALGVHPARLSIHYPWAWP